MIGTPAGRMSHFKLEPIISIPITACNSGLDQGGKPPRESQAELDMQAQEVVCQTLS